MLRWWNKNWIIASMSSKNRIFLDMSRTVNSLEKQGVIPIEFSHIYINVTNDIVPPLFELYFLSSHFASIWEFSKMLLLNFGMSAISDCPFIILLFCYLIAVVVF